MGFRSDFSLLDLEELHAPTQTLAPVVSQRYCLQNAAQYRLENELMSKAWTITDASGEVVFRVRGKKVDWYKSKRELLDESGNTVVYMEEKVCPVPFYYAQILCGKFPVHIFDGFFSKFRTTGWLVWYFFQIWTLKNVWKAFAPGEQEPLFTLKSLNAFSFKPRVNIFLPSNTAQKQPDYTIVGGFLAKKCRIYFGEELVAEVRDLFFLWLLLLFHGFDAVVVVLSSSLQFAIYQQDRLERVANCNFFCYEAMHYLFEDSAVIYC